MNAALILHIEGTLLGEGPVWNHRQQVLHWVDIPRGLIHTYDPQTDTNESVQLDRMVGAAIPCEHSEEMILATQHGFAFFDPATEALYPITDPEADKPLNRFNDGKCDPAGRLWAGTMAIDPPRGPVGGLYRLNTDLGLTQQLTDIVVSNGLAWTKAHDRMFYIDTRQFKMMSFDFDNETGSISNQQDFLTFEDDLPDGMCIDENDNLWVAFYLGGKVVCYDSTTGKALEQITVPARCTTSCCFGGPDLDTLYITSGAKADDPLAGGLFAVQPGVKGLPSVFFQGKRG